MKFLVLDFSSILVDDICTMITDIDHQAIKVDSQISIEDILAYRPDGIVLSGSSDTVYDNGRKIDKKIYDLNIPILGICYGMQLTNYLLGGEVKKSLTPELNQQVTVTSKSSPLFANMPMEFDMFMLHHDEVVRLANGFENIASTVNCKNAACQNLEKKIFCTQFHPEKKDNEYGKQLFMNFVNICKEK